MAAVFDKLGVRLSNHWYEANLTGGTYTGGTSYNVGIDQNDLETGMYIFEVYANTYNGGASQYSCFAASEPIFWNNTSSNANKSGTINFGPYSGHAPNTYTQPESHFELKIRHYSGTTLTQLQINFATTHTIDGTSGRSFRIRAYRIGK